MAACSDGGSTSDPDNDAGGAAGSASGGASTGGKGTGGKGTGGKSSSTGGEGPQGYDCDGADCDDGNECTTDSCTSKDGCRHEPSDAACDDDDACTVDSCGESGCEHAPLSASVTIAPDAPTLVVENGVAATQTFSASLGDVDVTSCIDWSLASNPAATIDGSTVTTTGTAGGPVVLQALLGSELTTGNFGVQLLETRNTGSVSEEDIDALNKPSETPDPALAISYPYDDTVFPLGVRPPKLQFAGGGASDVYKLVIQSDFFTYVDYIQGAPPARFDLDASIWEKLGASGQGAKSDAITVSLTRRAPGATYAPVTQTWHIAQAKLHGSVYYRETAGSCSSSTGDVRKIPMGATSATTVSTGCTSCHDVSRDGRTLLATYEAGQPFPFNLTDLQTGQASAFTKAVTGSFGAFNPTGDKALVSHDNAAGSWKMSIVGVPSGEVLTPNVLGSACSEPAWSPDGKHVAAICNLTGNGGWAFDATGGDLSLGAVDDDGVTVGAGSVLVAQAGGNGRPAYPSFSGDSKLLAYSRTDQGSRSTGNGELWVTGVDGSLNTQLLALKGSVTSDRNFYPTFAPYRAGGYYWIAFTSRRDYGNVLSEGANTSQIWIAAIDENLEGDPSQPAFYLDGQLSCAGAYEARFARNACLDAGEVCESGVDCCGGTCLVTAPDVEARCTTQPSGECVAEYNACAQDADCCGSPAMICVDKICQSAKR